LRDNTGYTMKNSNWIALVLLVMIYAGCITGPTFEQDKGKEMQFFSHVSAGGYYYDMVAIKDYENKTANELYIMARKISRYSRIG
jgi:hypothetical protein